MVRSSRRALFVIVFVLVTCGFLGMVFGQKIAPSAVAGSDSDVKDSLHQFTEVYNIVEQNYAEPVDPDRAIFGPTNSSLGAIPGALRTLDPHSNFFDTRSFSALREEQEGKYFGVGMQITTRPGKMGKLTTVVVAPIPKASMTSTAAVSPGLFSNILKANRES
jgi:carboxyl-terminal processing protease